MDFQQVNGLVASIYPLRKYFRGIITEFHQSMVQDSIGFWIYYIQSKPIGHYICIFEQNTKIFVFDSFGLDPTQYGLYIEGDYNNIPIQSDTSKNCGKFCLFFAFHSLFFPPHTVVSRYFQPKHYRFNEIILKSWLMKFLS